MGNQLEVVSLRWSTPVRAAEETLEGILREIQRMHDLHWPVVPVEISIKVYSIGIDYYGKGVIKLEKDAPPCPLRQALG